MLRSLSGGAQILDALANEERRVGVGLVRSDKLQPRPSANKQTRHQSIIHHPPSFDQRQRTSLAVSSPIGAGVRIATMRSSSTCKSLSGRWRARAPPSTSRRSSSSSARSEPSSRSSGDAFACCSARGHRLPHGS